jgi:hypothetical protein
MLPWRFGRSTLVKQIDDAESHFALVPERLGWRASIVLIASREPALRCRSAVVVPSKLYVRAYRCYICLAVLSMTPISN